MTYHNAAVLAGDDAERVSPRRKTIWIRCPAAPTGTTEAFVHGTLAVHPCPYAPQFWTVTHKASCLTVTAGHTFDSASQAGRYADELQNHIDFRKVGDPRNAYFTLGKERIDRAIRAALFAAFGA